MTLPSPDLLPSLIARWREGETLTTLASEAGIGRRTSLGTLCPICLLLIDPAQSDAVAVSVGGSLVPAHAGCVLGGGLARLEVGQPSLFSSARAEGPDIRRGQIGGGQ